jgi:hypothetical protein
MRPPVSAGDPPNARQVYEVYNGANAKRKTGVA